MKISGFTFVRNARLMGYPFIESIQSLLPLVDEFVINVGDSDDDTLAAIVALNETKIKIIQTTWNEKMSAKGFVYAQQKMIAQYSCTGDWAFYLEADEVLHEQDIPRIRACLAANVTRAEVEAIAFNYHHFYGLPSQTACSPRWYRSEVRIIRNTIRSYAPDGLYWLAMERHRRGRYPRAVHCDATIYHYGWVRSAEKMLVKFQRIEKYWDKTPELNFNYGNIDPLSLKPFDGSHPAVMAHWLATEAESNFALNPSYQLTRRESKHRWVMKIEVLVKRSFSKKHYRLVK